RRDLAIGKQHGREEMAEHGLAGVLALSPLAEVFRLAAPAGIERGRGAADDVFGALVHAGIRAGNATAGNTSLRAKRSNPEPHEQPGLLRRFAPRNDDRTYCAASAACSVG